MLAKTAVLLIALAAPAAAQLPVQTPIRVGESVTGTLDEEDARMPGPIVRYYESYLIQGEPGKRVIVWMSSDEFDTYLTWGYGGAGDWEEQAYDDDGGGGTDSRLMINLGLEGEYELRAAAFREGETGSYRLQVEDAPDPAAASIRVGETVHGELAEGDYQGANGLEDHWEIRAGARTQVTITAESDELDVYLGFGIWNGEELLPLGDDDDSGPGTDAHLVGEVEGRCYRVVVRSYSGGQTGAYTLRIAGGAVDPPPPDPQDAPRQEEP